MYPKINSKLLTTASCEFHPRCAGGASFGAFFPSTLSSDLASAFSEVSVSSLVADMMWLYIVKEIELMFCVDSLID